MASRRKRGPVAFRPRLSAGLALSTKFEHTPGVVGYQGSPIPNLRARRLSAFGQLAIRAAGYLLLKPQAALHFYELGLVEDEP